MEFYGIVNSIKSLFEENLSVDICTFGVLKEARGSGLASKLLQNFISYIKSIERVKYIKIECITYNDQALSFYKKHKFITKKIEKGYYYLNQSSYDAEILLLNLNK